MHFNGQSTISLDGEPATGESYCIAHHLFTRRRAHADARPPQLPRQLRQADGAWLFADATSTSTGSRPSPRIPRPPRARPTIAESRALCEPGPVRSGRGRPESRERPTLPAPVRTVIELFELVHGDACGVAPAGSETGELASSVSLPPLTATDPPCRSGSRRRTACGRRGSGERQPRRRHRSRPTGVLPSSVSAPLGATSNERSARSGC